MNLSPSITIWSDHYALSGVYLIKRRHETDTGTPLYLVSNMQKDMRTNAHVRLVVNRATFKHQGLHVPERSPVEDFISGDRLLHA